MQLTMKDKVLNQTWLNSICDCRECKSIFKKGDIVLDRLLNCETYWDSRLIKIDNKQYEPVCPVCGSNRVYDLHKLTDPIKKPINAIKCNTTKQSLFAISKIGLYNGWVFNTFIKFYYSLDENITDGLFIDIGDYIYRDDNDQLHIFDSKTKVEKYINLCNGCDNSRHASVCPFFCNKYQCITISPHGRCWIQS